MQVQSSTSAPAHAVRTAAIACAVLALLAAAAGLIAGQPLIGGALATGLALGAVNGALAARLFSLPVPFLATSLARLLTLSMIGIAIGLAFGLARVWLVILGVGVAQLALAGSALRSAIHE
jgi:hypothetical protein